eukprot:1849917-Amphidinium_carterae.1
MCNRATAAASLKGRLKVVTQVPIKRCWVLACIRKIRYAWSLSHCNEMAENLQQALQAINMLQQTEN